MLLFRGPLLVPVRPAALRSLVRHMHVEDIVAAGLHGLASSISPEVGWGIAAPVSR